MKHVNLRLPDDVHELAVTAAAADDRSLNSWLVAVVRRATETPIRSDRLSMSCSAGESATPPA